MVYVSPLQYEFTVENWVLSLQGVCGLNVELSGSQSRTLPSCPPHWMMFSSPQEGRMSRRRNSESKRCPRSLSLGAADTAYAHQHRSVKFLLESECDAGGYSEDDEGSSTEDSVPFHTCQCGERPRSSGAKRKGSRLLEIQQSTSAHLSGQSPPRNTSRPRRSLSTGQDIQLAPQRLASPQCHTQRGSKKRRGTLSNGRRHLQSQQSPAPITVSSALLQPRPSSAGHISTSRNHKPTVQARALKSQDST